MDPCCDTIIGGLVYIQMGARRYEAMADVTILPDPVERSADASQGGRLYTTERAKPARARMNFANYCNADPGDIFAARCHADITIVEKSRGFRHMFSKSSIVGTREINLSTGEVQGIEIATDRYKKVG